jgi:hypothetical protein
MSSLAGLGIDIYGFDAKVKCTTGINGDVAAAEQIGGRLLFRGLGEPSLPSLLQDEWKKTLI